MKQLIAILYGQSYRPTLSEIFSSILNLFINFFQDIFKVLNSLKVLILTNKKAIVEIVGTFLTFIMMVTLFLAFIYLFK